MAEKDHPFDGVADDLFEWMQGEVDYYVEAMRGGYRSPFSAPVSEKDKLDYYRRQVFTAKPDGSIDYAVPNGEGRDHLIKSLGLKEYAKVWDAVKPKHGLRPVPEGEDDLASVMPMMPEDADAAGSE